MKVIAWNVQRWGAATTPERRHALDTRIAAENADVVLYTELTTACTDPPAFNPTYRRENPAQLCYGAHRPKGGIVGFTRMDDVVTTPMYQDTHYTVNTFRTLLDRAPALVWDGVSATWGGTTLALLHAPASAASVQALVFLASWLESRPGDYVLIGDLNADPSAIKDAVTGTLASILQNRLRYIDIGTHEKGGRYDYVISRFKNQRQVDVRPVLTGLTYAASDHVPIVVEWGG
jgi:hypothetical protein